jgi:transposase
MRFVGIDWAHEFHVVAVLDEHGARVAERRVAHQAADLLAFLAWLDEQVSPADRKVGMESGAGLLVELFLDRGEPVYVFNPKVVDRARDKFSPAGAKDDRRDAEVIAELLRTDLHRFRPFEPDGELTTELRLRVRGRQRNIDKRTAAANELVDALRRYFPAAVHLPTSWHDPWFVAFLQRWPDPSAAEGAADDELTKLLRQHRIRKWDVGRLKAHLQAERLPVRDAVVRGYRALVLDLAGQLATINAQIAAADTDLESLLEKHPDREVMLSLAGVRTILAARLLAEIGDDRIRLADHRVLQARAGTAPVTKQSGKARPQVQLRRGCSHDLRNAFFLQAATSRAKSAWAAAFYDHQRTAGHGHAAATRAVANKWAKIIAALLVSKRPYDPARHEAELTRRGVPWWVNRRPTPDGSPKSASRKGKAA